MTHLINLFGAIALIFWGTYMVKSGMLRTFGMSLRSVLSHDLNNRFKGFAAGFCLSSLLQSSTAATLLIAGLQSEGLISTLVAVSCIFGAELGSAFVACLLSFNFAAIAPLLIPIGVILFFYCKPSTRPGQFGRILLGLAFIMIAINQIVVSTAPLRTNPDIASFFEILQNMPLFSFAAGMILAIVCVSSLAAVILISSLAMAHALNFDAALWMMIGANAGSTLLAILATMFASAVGRRGPWATALCRSGMILLAMIVLSTGLNQKVSLPQNIVVCHLIFNSFIGAMGLLLVNPLSCFIEKILFSKNDNPDIALNYKKLFAQENFLTVSISLSAAKKYLHQEFEGLRLAWIDVDTLLRSNPNPGNIMIIKNAVSSVLKLNRGISHFLNQAVTTNLNSSEAIEWQYLKAINGTLKSAINLIDHTIDVINEQKCLKHLDFSQQGLKALTESHRLVLACIETFIAYQKCTKPEKRRELVRRLHAHQQNLLTATREQTKLHLLRIANNTAPAIETDTLHLEIQSLFNRLAALICTSVNLEPHKN